MCMYCERRQDVKFGWEQPKLPYHNEQPMYELSGNALDNDKWEGAIHDYQTTSPQLVLTCEGYFGGEGVGTIYIPVKYCPECGKKLGKQQANTHFNIGDNVNIKANVVDYNEGSRKVKVRIEGFGENKHDRTERYIWLDQNNMF